jgi:hypothetical protein
MHHGSIEPLLPVRDRRLGYFRRIPLVKTRNDWLSEMRASLCSF